MGTALLDRAIEPPPRGFVIPRPRPDLGIPGPGPSRWVTRQWPKVERIACPWLIRRFLDRNAVFYFAAESEVLEQARTLGAVPFDVLGVEISHRWEKCSFDALLDAFGIHCSVLDHVARIVRAADTERLGVAPEAAGLLALSTGLARHFAGDHEKLEAGMLFYDCLYAWCAGGPEPHGWTAHD